MTTETMQRIIRVLQKNLDRDAKDKHRTKGLQREVDQNIIEQLKKRACTITQPTTPAKN